MRPSHQVLLGLLVAVGLLVGLQYWVSRPSTAGLGEAPRRRKRVGRLT